MSRLFQRFGNRKIVTTAGTATMEFDRGLQKAFDQLETQIADLTGIVADIETLQADMLLRIAEIEAAQAAADAAQSDATDAAREAARLNSYSAPTNVLTATDAGADATIAVANHTRIYPVQGAIDVPDVSITGAAITGLAYSTQYWVYYDDTTLATPAPTFIATTSIATAQVGAAAGRHFVGTVTTPASGGAATGGSGGTPPGGGGGAIP